MLAKARFWRHLGKSRGSSTVQHYVWAQMSSYFAGAIVGVVGVGPGACAQIALEAGALHVHGLDLRATLPLLPHQFRSYVPPLVEASPKKTEYTHSPLCLLSSGDWNQATVASRFLAETLCSVLVLDLETGTPQSPLELLRPLCTVSTVTRVILRCRLEVAEAELLLADLIVSGTTPVIYLLDRYEVVSHWLFTFQPPDRLQVASGPVQLQGLGVGLDPDSVTGIPLTWGGGPGELYSELLDYTYFFETTTSPEELQSCASVLLGELLGKNDTRLHYHTWGRMLEGLFALSCATRSPEALLPIITNLVTTGEHGASYDNHSFVVHWTPSLNHLLTRVIPRLLPYPY